MTNETINEAEIQRIEFLALQTVTKALLHAVATQSGNPDVFCRDLATLYSKSVNNFQYSGVSPEKARAAKELMDQFGVEWISQAARQR